jgi:hypothetical protein
VRRLRIHLADVVMAEKTARVDARGENFDLTWDDDGHTNTLWHFDLGLIELIREPSTLTSRATPVSG